MAYKLILRWTFVFIIALTCVGVRQRYSTPLYAQVIPPTPGSAGPDGYSAAESSGVCIPGSQLTAPDTDSRSTDSAGSTDNIDTYPGVAEQWPGNEYTYVFSPTFSGQVTVTLAWNPEPGNSAHLFVLDGAFGACNAQSLMLDDPFVARFDAQVGHTYYIVVDSYSVGVDYDINLVETRPLKYVFIPMVRIPPVYTFTGTSLAGDGEVGDINCNAWESCRSAAHGNFAANNNFYASVEASDDSDAEVYNIKRIFLLFNTSSIPPNAHVISATLRFYTGPYQNGSRVHVVLSQQDTNLSNNDFGRVSFTSLGSKVLATPYTWVETPLPASIYSSLIVSGTARLALMHDLDLTNTLPEEINNVLIVMSEDENHPPTLIIRYSPP